MAKLAELVLWGERVPSGPLELSFELSQPWIPGQVEAVHRIVADFAAAGNLGAYPSADAQPSVSSLVLTSSGQVFEKRLTFELVATAIEGRAYQFLRHMAARLEYGEASLRRIDVREPRLASLVRRSLPIIDEDEDEAELYPEPRAKYSFEVEWDEEGDRGKFRRLLIEFYERLQWEHFDLLAVPINAWGKLLEGGAFTMPIGMPDMLDNVMGQTTLFDAFTAEVAVPVYRSSEVGWDILLNMLDAFSQHSRRIANIVIE